MMQKDAVKCIFLLNESVFASKLRRSRVRTALKRRMNIIQNIIHIMFGNVCQCVSILLTPGQWLQDCGCKGRTNVSLLLENSDFNHSCYLLLAASKAEVGTGDLYCFERIVQEFQILSTPHCFSQLFGLEMDVGKKTLNLDPLRTRLSEMFCPEQISNKMAKNGVVCIQKVIIDPDKA